MENLVSDMNAKDRDRSMLITPTGARVTPEQLLQDTIKLK
jgi:hypothetical protein